MYTDVYSKKTSLHTPLYDPVERTFNFQSSVLIFSDFRNYWLRNGVLEDTPDKVWRLMELFLNSK